MFVIIEKSILIWFVTFIGQTKNKECARFHRQWGISFIPLKTEMFGYLGHGDFNIFTLGCPECNQERDIKVIFLLDENDSLKGGTDTSNLSKEIHQPSHQ